MDEYVIKSSTPEQAGEIIASAHLHALWSTMRWLEILYYDHKPATGVSPKEILWQKNKARLYHYQASTEKRYKTPILMIYALINKPYVMDLAPNNSLVEYLVNDGYDVYLLDWGEFEWEDRDLTYADFVYDYVAPSAKRVARCAGTPDITIIGYCMGGTITTMYAALFDKPILRNLVYLAVPIDFNRAGLYDVWLRAKGYDPDRIADTLELVPADFIDWGTRMLNPMNNYWGTYSRLWKTINDDESPDFWKYLNKWTKDNINFPGGAYRDWIRDFYQGNKLIKNQIVLRGRRVQLQKIKANLLALVGSRDHIALPHQTEASLSYLSSKDKTYREFNVGHGGLILGETARTKVFPFLSAWLAKRSETCEE